ncbi:MAG TPA: DUF1656 domain-containing protein [Xanthobacteraceae bacterium]|nr:DUF1656 domain-containing protein [Xanthobacteraceae bacterium]
MVSVPSLSLFHTVNIIGLYLPPLLVWAGAALLPFLVLRWAFGTIGLYRAVWHRPLFNLALYVLVLSGMVFLGNLAWL